MQAGTDALITIANHWLGRFEAVLQAGDEAALKSLFIDDSHWRDVLALTWRIQTVSGVDHFAKELLEKFRKARANGLRTDPERTPPRHAMRAGEKCVEAIFRFETAQGIGSGLVRFRGNEEKAWTLLTALEELKGHEEHTGKRRPDGQAYSRDFRGPNWLDLRRQSSEYKDRDPAVLVVGGGQAGLSIAARLGARRGHADRRPRRTRRRQLAQALSRAHAAQPGAREPPAVHALPTELPGLHPEGQARQLVRGLCRGDGAQFLDRYRVRARRIRRAQGTVESRSS